ncbi:hypothetical protein [Flavobacterium taihuense]|uniref:Fibronectin type-III domain-containing protein n=1 Tax=Flavobacterium taihuense TaxID=2857508 RepID=A0ABS6XWP4_9FLAO|nr:hypothetical protein [Flavobacterium taihuense]MBW4361108.1 hypothetical protein [Flavobacterium taihuense]
MKQFLRVLLFCFCIPSLSIGQSIFSNPINGVNPNDSNPYTSGQIVSSDITVSGIGRGSGIFGINANNRYDARSWKSDELDSNTYFEFSLTPNPTKEIDFVSFVYTGQISENGPTRFALRSSVDGFTSDVGTVLATGATVSLSSSNFQNISSPITFRLYGWGANAGTGTFSVNDFEFRGIVSCVISSVPILTEIALPCLATSFELSWNESEDALDYFIDVATDSDFVNSLSGYQNKEIGNVLMESILGLKPGESCFVRLRSANSCGVSANSNTIRVSPVETIYNHGWSNGIPDRNKKVRFSSDFLIDSALEACSCQIDSGVAVKVESGSVLQLENELSVLGTASLTFENDASLVQVNDLAVNTGDIIYRRITAPMKNFDFTYWSSPVKNQVLNILSPNTFYDKYFSFADNKWVTENGNSTMNPAGKGFIIRVPKPNIAYANGEYWNGVDVYYKQQVQFVGMPYNGIINISVLEGQNNLIGNPYPSAVDADSFILKNASVLYGALYFWTHNSTATKTGNQYFYNSDDYATYNLTGGTRTAVEASTGGGFPSGKIAAGQSFFVGSKVAGSFEFNNAMRIFQPGLNNQFFKNEKTKERENVAKNRIWLNFTSAKGVFKQLLVGYIDGATNDLDDLYDGISFNGNSDVDFYSINKIKKLSIQGRALPFYELDSVPLGYKSKLGDTFTISIDQVDGLFNKRQIFLEDKSNGVIHNLGKSPYVFSTQNGEYNERFVLRYTSAKESVLKNDVFDNSKQQFEIAIQGNQLNFKSINVDLSTVFIYDLKGALLYQRTRIDNRQIVVSNLILKHQILIVKTVFGDNTSRTDKVFF